MCSSDLLEMEGRMHGYHGAVGARFRPSEFVGAFVQLDFAQEELIIDRASVTQDGFGFTSSSGDFPKIGLKSQALLLGVDLGT